MKLLTLLGKNASLWFVSLISVLFVLLRLPSLFEPYWYGDEGIYEVIGFALTHGRLLYSGIWDNKPPMLYLIYALFSGDQMAARTLSLLAGLLATLAVFFLSKKLFAQLFAAIATTSVFAILFGIPLIEGNIANAENFMLLPAALAGFLVYKSFQQKKSMLVVLLAGVLLGISFLIKVVALFDLSAFMVFIFLISLKNFSIPSIFSSIKKVIPLLAGFLFPLVLCVGFFIFHHTFATFVHSTLFSNVGYVNYGNQFIIPQGFLILKTLIVLAAVVVMLIKRKSINTPTLFIYVWVIFSLYASVFSGRPYTHYALVLLPSFSLLVGLFLANKYIRLLTGISLVACIIFITKSFTLYNHSIEYYDNFLQYTLGQKSQTAYQSFFDRVTSRDQAIAEVIVARKKQHQTLFVWGNSGQIYKLTNLLPPGRFIVAYHITMSPENLRETKRALEKNPPTFIVQLPNQEPIPFSLAHYQELLMIEGATIYEHIL